MLLTIEQHDDVVQVSADGVTVTFDREEYKQVTPKEILDRVRNEVHEHGIVFSGVDNG